MKKYLIKATNYTGMDKAIGNIVDGEDAEFNLVDVTTEELIRVGADPADFNANETYCFELGMEVEEIIE